MDQQNYIYCQTLQIAIQKTQPSFKLEYIYKSAVAKDPKDLGKGNFGVIYTTTSSSCLKTIKNSQHELEKRRNQFNTEKMYHQTLSSHQEQEAKAWIAFINECEIHHYVKSRLEYENFSFEHGKSLQADDRYSHIVNINRFVGFYDMTDPKNCMRFGLEMSLLTPLKTYLLDKINGRKSLFSNKNEFKKDLKSIFLDMAEAVLQLHLIGIVHNDIAMRNFLVDTNVTKNIKCKVLICDLGLACHVQETFEDTLDQNLARPSQPYSIYQTLDQMDESHPYPLEDNRENLKKLRNRIKTQKKPQTIPTWWTHPSNIKPSQIKNLQNSHPPEPHICKFTFETDLYQLGCTYGEITYFLHHRVRR